ncbi:Hypp4608 [Branchiostoma lanceolatum]|uniref:Hypp4608 protein n=1 Tax=Branchiostoma lanceolatum TaxID=7740 RepID=A0A8K0EYJ5_BRALA|nr:Hypp4608 [Branchiostoma lanceolatum]
MSAVCNMLTTLPLSWTHLAAFASGCAVFAMVFYCSGRLFSRLSPAFCSLGPGKRVEVRYHAALGLADGITGMLAVYVSFFGHLSLDLISKDISIVRLTSAFNLGVVFADSVIGVIGPVTEPGVYSVRFFTGALHHVITAFAELMSLVHGLDPYVVVFHQRMDLVNIPARLRAILRTLGVSRDAPGYQALWVGSAIFHLYIRVLVLPFYCYDLALVVLPRMAEIKSCGYWLGILLFVCQPLLYMLNVYWWSTGFMSLKRYFVDRKTKVN